MKFPYRCHHVMPWRSEQLYLVLFQSIIPVKHSTVSDYISKTNLIIITIEYMIRTSIRVCKPAVIFTHDWHSRALRAHPAVSCSLQAVAALIFKYFTRLPHRMARPQQIPKAAGALIPAHFPSASAESQPRQKSELQKLCSHRVFLALSINRIVTIICVRKFSRRAAPAQYIEIHTDT